MLGAGTAARAAPAWPSRPAGGCAPCSTSRSTRSPTCRTPRSSSTRAGTAAPTSSRTRSPTRSSPRCSARRSVKADPRLLRLRLLLRLRHLRGRHRHLLGAQPRARVPEQDPAAPARGREDRARARTRPASAGSSSTRSSTARGQHDLAELRTLPGLVPALPAAGVPGVAEVATVGGFVKQYQVTVDPNRLRAYDVADHGRSSTRSAQGNDEVGGRLLEFAGARVHGARPRLRARSLEDLEQHRARRPTSAARRCWCATWRAVTLGPEIRRGVADLDGQGDAVGGIVVMRHGENALRRDRARQGAARRSSQPSLPDGRRDRDHLRPLGADRARRSTR